MNGAIRVGSVGLGQSDGQAAVRIEFVKGTGQLPVTLEMEPIMNLKKITAVILLASTLGACANGGYGGSGLGSKETLGTLGGAALGGWAGSNIGHGTGQLIATAAGVVIGGFIGNQ